MPKRKTPKPSLDAIKKKADAAVATSAMEKGVVTGIKSERPTKYTPEIGKRICLLLAEGRTLTSICRDIPSLPTDQTIRNWALDPEHPFSSQYTRAREIGYHAMADTMVDISDENLNDTYMDEDGNARVNHDVIARSKLRFDARKWLLSKALPKIYGEKVALDHSGKVEQVHSEAPQPVDSDHMADITNRFASKIPSATLSTSGPKATGKGSSGLH